MHTHKYDEPECLACNPFEGDFGEPGDRTLVEKIVTLRRPRKCALCGQMSVKGTRCRVNVEIFDGKLMSYTWCEECCSAMADSWTDQGRALEKRAALNKEASCPSRDM